MPRLLVTLIAVLWSVASFPANPQVELKTNMGAIVLELYPERAPATVQNFIQYVKDGHYNGTLFHRVIPKFMIQGGGFSPDFKQKPARQPIRNEAANGIKNTVGTVAMARTSDPHSATAQFFINVADNDFLDFRYPTREGYGYCAFGRVVKGMNVVQRIASVATGPGPSPHRDVPRQPVVIERAHLLGAAEKVSK
jgi:peptidyl-prolyl cis-trans isomerase A (cyclophilin A)/peptidyl-prolyl cis-trans isomerase B (cyclophilin B)